MIHKSHTHVDSHGNLHTAVQAPEIGAGDAAASFTLLGLLLALVVSVFTRRAKSRSVPVRSL